MTTDSATGTTGQLAFYGIALYRANPALFNGAVMISTPITADRFGNIYFGFLVTGALALFSYFFDSARNASAASR